MRKQTKKVLSWVLAGAMALSLIPSVEIGRASCRERV